MIIAVSAARVQVSDSCCFRENSGPMKSRPTSAVAAEAVRGIAVKMDREIAITARTARMQRMEKFLVFIVCFLSSYVGFRRKSAPGHAL